MQQSTTTPEQDTFTTSENAESQHSKNSLILERVQIEKTPFWKLRTEEGYFLAMGNNRLTELIPFDFDENLYLKENIWQLIMQVCIITQRQIITEFMNMK